jgi:AraC-like DNA-binding protein
MSSIRRMLAELAVVRPLRVQVAQRSAAPAAASHRHGHPRLLFALAGVHRVRTGGHAQPLALHRGEALWLPAGSWHAVLPGPSRWYASLTWRDGAVACYSRCHAGGAGITGPGAWTSVPWAGQAPAIRALLLAARQAEHLPAMAAGIADALVGLALAAGPAEVAPADRWDGIAQLVEEHLPEGIPCARLARLVGMHPATLSRLCRRHAGMSLVAFLAARRLEAARQLLRQEPGLPVAALARRCGWQDVPYFRSCYRRRFGITPGCDHLPSA